MDALTIINLLNRAGPHFLLGLNDAAPYPDVDGDGFLTPLDAPFSLAGTTLIRGSLQPVPLAAWSDQFGASYYNGRWPAETAQRGPLPEAETDLLFSSLGSDDLEDVLSDVAADVQDDWGQDPLVEDVEKIWTPPTAT